MARWFRACTGSRRCRSRTLRCVSVSRRRAPVPVRALNPVRMSSQPIARARRPESGRPCCDGVDQARRCGRPIRPRVRSTPARWRLDRRRTCAAFEPEIRSLLTTGERFDLMCFVQRLRSTWRRTVFAHRSQGAGVERRRFSLSLGVGGASRSAVNASKRSESRRNSVRSSRAS